MNEELEPMRLLTVEEQRKYTVGNGEGFHISKMLEAQDAKTHALDQQHEQEIVQRIFLVGNKLLDALSHADFSNGIEAQGTDEGRVLGYRFLKELKEEWRTLKKQERIK